MGGQRLKGNDMIRRVLAAGFGLVAVMMIGTAGAMACTAAPTMTLKPMTPAAAGASRSTSGGFVASAPAKMVTVNMANGSWATNQAVQIHWNSLNGPVLATTAGPNFSVPVQVPQVTPGVYYVVAADQAGTIKMAQTLEVTGPASAPSPAALPRVATSGSGNMVLGAGLLGGGLVALFSAAAVVTLRRRKATATVSH